MITLVKYCGPLWATTSSYYVRIITTCVLMEGQTQKIQRQQNVYWVQGKVKSVYQPSGPSCQADHGFYSVEQLGIFLLPLVGMLVHHKVILNIKFASTHCTLERPRHRENIVFCSLKTRYHILVGSEIGQEKSHILM